MTGVSKRVLFLGAIVLLAACLVEAEVRTPPPKRGGRPYYPPCKGGSGGQCIKAGECADDKKNAKGTCAEGQECCRGYPKNDKGCVSRGGECHPSCGKGPKLEDSTECHAGAVCCVHVQPNTFNGF